MKFFRELALTALSLIALLLLLEAALRLSGVKYNGALTQPETSRGFTLRPYAAGWETGEGENYVRINSRGMRDRERTVSRPERTIRIAVLGASDVEARQVSLEQSFTGVLERDLSRALDPAGWKIEVLNFGEPSYGLAQNYLTLRDHVWQYDPQIIVLGFSKFSMLKSTRALMTPDGSRSPVFVYRDGKLVEDAATQARKPVSPRRVFIENLISEIYDRVYLLELINTARLGFSTWLTSLRARLSAPHAPLPGALPAEYVTIWPLTDPRTADPRVKDAWKVSEGLILAMRDDARAHGAEFWLVTMDWSLQAHPDQRVRDEFQKFVGLPSLFLCDRYIDEFARGKGIHSVMLAPVLADYSLRHNIALRGFWNSGYFAHWNELGHQVAAEATTGAMLRESKVLHARGAR